MLLIGQQHGSKPKISHIYKADNVAVYAWSMVADKL